LFSLNSLVSDMNRNALAVFPAEIPHIVFSGGPLADRLNRND
jgi:hypothetical protein